jgi:hypothetical protein
VNGGERDGEPGASGDLCEGRGEVCTVQTGIVSHGRKTIKGLMRHTNIAANETMHVSKKVTNITQTPYAFPRDVVCRQNQYPRQ